MIVPEPIIAHASTATLMHASPVEVAVNLEIVSNQVTPAGLSTVLQACSEGHILDAFGGPHGAIWAAYNAARLNVNGDLADWVIAVMAENNGMQAAAGSIQPSLLKQWDKQANKIVDDLHATLHAVIIDAIERVATRAGVLVMAWLRDPNLKAKLACVPLCDVAAAAEATMFTKTAQTVWAAAHVNVHEVIDKETPTVAKGAGNAVNDAETSLRTLASDLFQVEEIPQLDTAAVTAAVVALFRRLGENVAKIPASNARGAITRILDSVTPSDRSIQNHVLSGLVRRIPDNAKQKALDFRRVLQGGQFTLVQIYTWRHGYYGSSGSPFPPHLSLNGLEAGTSKFELAKYAPYSYVRKSDSQIRNVEPFTANGWHPGDHDGCRCGYEISSQLTRLD